MYLQISKEKNNYRVSKNPHRCHRVKKQVSKIDKYSNRNTANIFSISLQSNVFVPTFKTVANKSVLHTNFLSNVKQFRFSLVVFMQ